MSVDFFEDGPTINPKKVKKGSTTPILDNFSNSISCQYPVYSGLSLT